MKKFDNWDSIATQTYGSFPELEPGAYVCNILKVEAQNSKSGKEGVLIYFDIAEGPNTNFYRKRFDRDRDRDDRKWRGTYWQMTEGMGQSYFKGFITALEESNPSYHWDWEESHIKGLKCGVVFGREQYKVPTSGELRFATKPQGFCSAEKARSGAVAAPKDKLYQEPTSGGFTQPYVPVEYQTPPPQYEALADDEEIPF